MSIITLTSTESQDIMLRRGIIRTYCTRQESAEKQIQCDLFIDVYVERDYSLKKLTHVVMQAGNSRIYRPD